MKRFLTLTLALLLTFSFVGAAFAGTEEPIYTYLSIRDDTMRKAEMNVEYDLTRLEDRSTTHVEVGRLISFSATPITLVDTMYFKWDDDTTYKVESSLYKDTIPDFEIGSVHYLYVIALYKNGEYSEQKAYKFIIDERTSPADADDYWADINELTYFERVYTTADMPINAKLWIFGDCSDGVSELSWKWDDGEEEVYQLKEGTTSVGISIPEEFEIGSIHTLTLGGRSRKNIDAIENTYQMRIVENMEDFISVGIIDRENAPYSIGKTYNIQYGKNIEIRSSAFSDNLKVKYSWWDYETEIQNADSTYFEMNCCHGEDGAHDLYATAFTDRLESMTQLSQIYIYD